MIRKETLPNDSELDRKILGKLQKSDKLVHINLLTLIARTLFVGQSKLAHLHATQCRL